MAFDHHKLDVYGRSLTLLGACDQVASELPQGRSHLRDQMDRAACSIVAASAEAPELSVYRQDAVGCVWALAGHGTHQAGIDF